MSFRPQSSSRAPPPPTGPKTIKLRPHSLLSLPYRLTHPPPPQPKASAWGITPRFRIPLDEILDRKHLPPLGLKDFEEWLLFIDRMPECLYFILWLREYKTRYTAWRRQSKPSSPIRCSSNPHAQTYRSVSVPPPPNPALAQFYMRAKETFLTPNAPYALPIPSDLLASFSSTLDLEPHGRRPSSFSIHGPDPLLTVPGQPPLPPYPEIFEELEERVTGMLSDSLDRFVVATFHNVGMPRAYCGCAGGTVIGLTGSLPVLLANFLTGGSRWWRFSALPGLWLGMTIVISAMYGVCMMIYVFGDLRQLRSFELARLPIAPPSTSSSLKAGKEKEKEPVSKLFSPHPAPEDGPNNAANTIQLLTGPSPFLRQSVSGDSAASPPNSPTSFASISPLSRSLPPKLHLDPPPVAHTFAHIQTSSRADPAYSSMPSMSSASHRDRLKYLLRTSTSGCNVDDAASVSESDYDSDYETESETDASSESSHDSQYSADARMATPANEKRPRVHRRRRREPEIHISDAIFDEDPSPEGPATAEPQVRRRSSVWGGSSDEDVGTGATFIHPFQWDQLADPKCAHDVESQAQCAVQHQRIDAFDFDGLPKRARRQSRSESTVPSSPSATTPAFALPNMASQAPAADMEKPSRGVHFAFDTETTRHPSASATPANREGPPAWWRTAVGLLQQKCGPSNVAMYFLGGAGDSTSTVTGSEGVGVGIGGPERPPDMRGSIAGPISPTSTLRPPSVNWPRSATSDKAMVLVSSSFSEKPQLLEGKTSWRKRVRRMLQVPAFASPLTPVLNPIVTRGQWEIVVRSAVIAFVVSTLIIGGLVAVPETRHH